MSKKNSFWLRLSCRRYKNLSNLFCCYFCFALFIFSTFIPCAYSEIMSNSKNSVDNFSSNNNIVEGSGSIPEQSKNEWQASGINPDDEPEDDIEQGSGNIIEGSGTPTKMYEQNFKTIPPKSTMNNKFNINNEKIFNNFSIYKPTTPIIHHSIETKIKTTRSTIKFPIIETTLNARTIITTSKSFNEIATIQKSPPSIKKISQLPPYISEPADSFEILKPGILAAISGGAVVGVLLTILIIMFIVYRMRKKDEGSYSLDEPHQPSNYSYAYQKASTKEFYA